MKRAKRQGGPVVAAIGKNLSANPPKASEEQNRSGDSLCFGEDATERNGSDLAREASANKTTTA